MISIIVPVYNVEKYLKQCIESILQQTYKDLEIILVDDGSKDSSPEICDHYALIDSRIRVIHKKNGGLMSAWKEGVNHSRGQFLGFVDSDDWIDPDMYETLYNEIIKNDSDIVLCGWVREKLNAKEKEVIFLKEEYYDKKKLEECVYPYLISFGKMFERFVSPNRVTKLFRRELIEKNMKYCDEKISVGEDMVISFSSLFDANAISVLQDYYPYHYRMNETSIMQKANLNFYDQTILLNEKMKEILQEKNIHGYKFDIQLNNDLLSMAFWGIERVIMSQEKKVVKLQYIKNVLNDCRLKEALRRETLTKYNKKCRIYKLLTKLNWNWGIYIFISKIVLKKRQMFGY